MRRRTFPNLVTDISQLDERQERLERLMQMIGFSPDLPYTLTVNDGTLNKVEIGLCTGGTYGIRIINNAGAEIVFADGHISASGITVGTLDASLVNVTNLSASSITTGTLSASRIAGGNLNCTLITMSSVSAAWITTGTFATPNNRFADGTISGVKITDDTIEAPKIKTNSLTADKIQVHTLTGTQINLTVPLVTDGRQVANAIITNAHISTLSADKITTGTLNADRIVAGSLNGVKLTSGTVDDVQLRVGGISSSRINSLNANVINAGIITGITVQSAAGGSKVVLSNGNTLSFYYGGSLQANLHSGGDLDIVCDGTFLVGDSLQSNLCEFGNIYMGFMTGSGEGSIYNLDVLHGYNDLRFLLDDPSHVFRFYGGEWNQKLWIDWWGNLMSQGGIWVDGDMSCGGSKPFRIDHPEDPKKYLTYTAVESPEVALEIRGRARLAQGRAVVNLPHHWDLATEDGLTTYQVTALGACSGLYVREISKTEFEVASEGLSEVEFCWAVSATRRGFAGFDPEPLKDDVITQQMARAIENENKVSVSNPKVDNLSTEEDRIHKLSTSEYHRLKKERDLKYKPAESAYRVRDKSARKLITKEATWKHSAKEIRDGRVLDSEHQQKP